MSESNKTYRIRLGDATMGYKENDYISVAADLVQDYDTFEILSLKINSTDTYKLHNSNYGVVVGRVLANNGFGIPNAKISVFIQTESGEDSDIKKIYPFSTTASLDENGVAYNLLPDEQVTDCHQVVGTFPNKRYALDNDVILEVFDKYYKYTTRTNNSGDYLIMGVPTGTHTLHMDLDLSDCGILSQRPRDFVYKGYTIEQFENPNMFKSGTTYSTLSQVFRQDQVVNVNPFWGNSTLGETIGITRADIDVSFKFEPTCVFMGSVGSDNASQGISKKCMPTPALGGMDEMVTGEGTIEMIRKTPAGNVEEFQIKGTQLINSNGVWCYQIPMNLDYMMTDEYGNMVPTDDPDKGIPTRASVRFRISMQDAEANTDNYFRPKVLVPNNPQNTSDGLHENYDYEFGSLTRDDSFRDLFWNNVYSVKSFIPRFQKRKVGGWKEDKFSGIKHCNFYGANNPIPYNNIRIKLPFMFVIICAIFKCFVFLTGIVNYLISALGNILADIGNTRIMRSYPFKSLYKQSLKLTLNVLNDGICPDLENWYFAPMFTDNRWDAGSPPKGLERYDILQQTLTMLRTSPDGKKTSFSEAIEGRDDVTSIDYQNDERDEETEAMCLTINTDYLVSCVEMNLANEYRVINFDFYNDWINGFIYIPRFMRYVRPKVKFLGITLARAKVKGCMDDTSIFAKSRKYTQMCSLGYRTESVNGKKIYTRTKKPTGTIAAQNNFHKKRGFTQKAIFGKNGGICHEHSTLKKQYVYYLKPCEWINSNGIENVKANLFATDIVLLGSLNDCDLYGIPQAFKHLSSSSYIMPTNLALTNMDTNGPLYANEDGTVCAGTYESSRKYIENGGGVTTVDISKDGLSSELDYYSAAQDSDLDTEYEASEPSDTVALTEAAGIAWNYTGPGQGEKNAKKMYYPGGHFLGLSCANAETNIKSCINLERICEQGATMSQRKEDISSYDKTTGEIEYTYTVPTGFISGDEVVDTEFRTMFATMNRKRLIATKRNTDSGYKMYDFKFLRPSNFDGAFKQIVSTGAPYNINIEVDDESTALSKYNIANASTRNDYDPSEGERTQTRTKESTSFDYYMYRFGYDIDTLNKGKLQERRFLYTSYDNYKYLPQYENSYYFYFGMKFGSTAIDDFNKDFFSTCDTTSLLIGNPTIYLNVKDIDLEQAKGTIHTVVANLDTPYSTIDIKCSTDPTKSKTYKRGIDTSVDWYDKETFDITDISFGEYEITVTDDNGTSASKSISVGMDIISYESMIYNYNTMNGDTDIVKRGGYINISNVKIDLEPQPSTMKVLLIRNDTDKIVSSGYVVTITGSIDLSGLTASNYSDAIYKLALQAKTGSELITLTTITFKHPNNVNIYMGFRNIYSVNITSDVYLSATTGWWKNITNTGDTVNWLYEKCFFKTNPNKEGFDAHLYVENGNKVLCGYPQNENLVDLSTYEYADDYDKFPGKIIDDEILYWPIITGDTATTGNQYSIMAINDVTIGCNYQTDLNKYFRNRKPCAYMYKDIDQDTIEYRILGAGHDSDITHTSTGNGMYYPTFTFPVLKRPFSAHTDMYIWDSKGIIATKDDITLYSTNEGFGAVINVYNGITKNGQFSSPHASTSSGTRIEYWREETTDSTVMPITFKYGSSTSSTIPNLTVQTNDLYGLTGTTYSDNIRKYFSGATTPISGITTINTSVEEWYPTDKIDPSNRKKADITSLDSSFNSGDFYDDVSFVIDENSKITGEFSGDGTSNATYFLCQNLGGVLKNTYKAIYDRVPTLIPRTYIICKYNELSERDEPGTLTYARIKENKIIYSISSEDDMSTETVKIKVNGILDRVLNGQPIVGIWPSDAWITPIYKNEIESTIFNDNLQDAIEFERLHVAVGGTYNPKLSYYVVGYSETDNGTMYKIYPYAIPVRKK